MTSHRGGEVRDKWREGYLVVRPGCWHLFHGAWVPFDVDEECQGNDSHGFQEH